MGRGLVVGVLVLAAGGGVAGWAGAFGGAGAGARGAMTHAVTRGALRISMKETGTLKAKNSVAIKAQIPGTAKIVWLIPEGAEVKQGDKLAELDKTETQRSVDELDGQVVQMESQVKTARTELDIQQAEGKASVEKSELAYTIKQKEMARFQESEEPQNHRRKSLAVEKAESEFQRKTDRFSQMQKLLDEGFVTRDQFEEEKIALRAAEVELQSAKEELDGYVRFTREIERKQKDSDLAESQRNLNNERLRADNLLDQKRVNHEQLARQFQVSKDRLVEQRKQLEAMTVKAPAPGIVVYQERGWNGEELKVGATVYNEQPFLQLPDLSEMEVTIGAHEADINKLKVGQKVFVTVDSFKGEQLSGEITRVAAIANERDWRSDVKKFEVVVTLVKTPLALKPGLTAKVEVLVGEVPNVLTVPLQAVFVREGSYFVFADAGGKPSRREVKLGESNDNYIVVREGVAEGDRVLLYNPEATEGSTPAAPGPAAPRPAPAGNGKAGAGPRGGKS